MIIIVIIFFLLQSPKYLSVSEGLFEDYPKIQNRINQMKSNQKDIDIQQLHNDVIQFFFFIYN